MEKSKSGCWSVLLGLILLIICVIIFAVALYIPQKVNQAFGAPISKLSLIQRITYPFELYQGRDSLLSAMAKDGDEEHFTIGEGESVSMICLRLEERGLIPSAELFRIYLIYTGMDRQIQTGTFRLNPSMTGVVIGQALVDPLARDIIFTILPGWRIEEIGQAFPTSGLAITAEAFLDQAYKPSDWMIELLDVGPIDSLEGYLYPESYQLSRQTDLDKLFEVILRHFTLVVDTDLRSAFERRGLSIHEAVTLASIIDREAIHDEEKPLIASVFFNRMAIGKRLETDPTVQYAIGLVEAMDTWWKSPLNLGDLQIASDYNTYLINGLPPGPISNPDILSLRSVAYPAETPYYYFRAACDGSDKHNFAITYAEHLENACP